MNIEKKGLLNKREYLGPVCRQMSGQQMIFPFVQYSLIFNIDLYMIWHYIYWNLQCNNKWIRTHFLKKRLITVLNAKVHILCQIMYKWILKISEYWTKGNIIGRPEICWPNWLKLFPFVQYFLFFNIHLYMIWHFISFYSKLAMDKKINKTT